MDTCIWVVVGERNQFLGAFTNQHTALQSISFSFHREKCRIQKRQIPGSIWEVTIEVVEGNVRTELYTVKPVLVYNQVEHL